MKWGKYLSGILLAILVLSSMSIAPASVEGSSSSTTEKGSPTPFSVSTTQTLEPTSTTEAVYGDTLKVNNHRVTLMSNFNVNGDLMSFTDSLTTVDPTDFGSLTCLRIEAFWHRSNPVIPIIDLTCTRLIGAREQQV